MGVANPEELHLQFAEHFNAGSLVGLVQLYEPNACLVPQPGVTAKGHAAVKQSLQRFLALKGSLVMTTDFVIQGDRVALLRGRWILKGPDRMGKLWK
jgi:ketosteroid isomerase-like protein